jgi:hypothetical protein
MRRIKTLLTIMVLVLMAAFSAPQAFAGIIHNPGADGDMSGPVLNGEIPNPPGVAGEMPTVGINGDQQTPGRNGDIPFPGFTGLWGFIAVLLG